LLATEAQRLIEQKEIDKVETLWMEQVESDPSNVDDFLATALLLRKAGEREESDALLDLLADTLKERALWPQRLRVLKEIARLSKKPASLRAPIEEAIRHAFADRRSLERVLRFAKIDDPQGNPAEKAEKAETWLSFDEGECFFMTGRGAGQVIELNPDLGVCRVDFEKEKRVSIPLGAASKFLVPLPPGHILREKIEAPDRLREEALGSPQTTLERILKAFGRPMGASEVRDALIGVVPETKWASWWGAARKHPQIVVSGSGAKATYSWSETTELADQSVQTDFDQASPRDKLDLARRHSSRTPELADYFSSRLAATAAKLAKSDPALAWEIMATLPKLPGRYESTLDGDSLLLGPAAARVAVAIPDRMLREQAIRTIREKNADWPRVFGELFLLEEDVRVASTVMNLLAEGGATDIRDRLVDETLRYPRRHPRAFFWYVRTISDSSELPPRVGFNVLLQILEALSLDQFAPFRARMKELFDKGSLATRIVMSSDDEEQARKLYETIERYGALEEYRREDLKGALVMRFPQLREPQAEPVYTTAESLEAKRKELENLKGVELPATLKAIQVAREMGDLRENFEYKAARQRQEYLSSRIAELQSELSRTQVIDLEKVDTAAVRVGTKIALRNGDVHREVTILGPWESDPEHGVYSNQSDVAKALLGRTVGEIASFMGNDYVIESIGKWK
jgi:transcription elongation GreA/GreB family factor